MAKRTVKDLHDLKGTRVLVRADFNVPLENGRITDDPRIAARLVADTMATVFVNDAFGTAHRAHASTEGVSHHVQRSVAGLLMEKELRYLGMARDAPDHPYVAVLGGAKVSDKIEVIENLLPKVDALLVGGGMAYTFLRAE